MLYTFSEQFSMNYNVGFATRNPEVNELYSNGLHQGVSGIEEGDINLSSENAIKNTLSFATKKKDKLFVEVLVYHQYIQDYIYLQAQDEFRLTIRGAFPVFRYEQADAQIYGLDLVTKYQINEKWLTELNYSFIQGNEIDDNTALINLPSNSILSTTSFQIPQVKSLKNVELQMIHKYVFEQTNITEDQDFVAPPDGYYLLGFRASAEKQFKSIRLEGHVGVENALNAKYRDYLNRQRYFGDEVGRNLTVGAVVSF
jgi:iron complex outermembrane receptor protein